MGVGRRVEKDKLRSWIRTVLTVETRLTNRVKPQSQPANRNANRNQPTVTKQHSKERMVELSSARLIPKAKAVVVTWCFTPSQPVRLHQSEKAKAVVVTWCFTPTQPLRFTSGREGQGEPTRQKGTHLQIKRSAFDT